MRINVIITNHNPNQTNHLKINKIISIPYISFYNIYGNLNWIDMTGCINNKYVYIYNSYYSIAIR